MTTMRCMTLNVRGLNDRQKARLMSAYVKRHEIDICMLQETHLVISTLGRLKASWVGEYDCSVFSRNAHGVEIWLSKGLQRRTQKIAADPNGRYVILSDTLLDRACRFVFVYGPNTDDPRELWRLVESLGTGAVIWCSTLQRHGLWHR
ncbi:hypothetical protein NDU88_010998 [Pleurodeles waltl]|uniref:exodeoxyribonuclease III n=1 Tax=Pleurodeles waltl TaxID=8319 RepID=A0AAV7R024_PLEWA|nr:hypothetical protein NDU88_010998 [Pleurodeles waltl]